LAFPAIAMPIYTGAVKLLAFGINKNFMYL